MTPEIKELLSQEEIDLITLEAEMAIETEKELKRIETATNPLLKIAGWVSIASIIAFAIIFYLS